MEIPGEPEHPGDAADGSRWLVIFNPASGAAGGRVTRADIVSHLSRAGVDFDIQETRGSDDAETLADRACAAGRRRFVIAGGDGTAHQVLNGLLAGRSPAPEDLTLAILPLGTGNDWSRSLGIPRKLEEACGVIASGCAVASDVGQVTFQHEGGQRTRYFLNVCGAGIDAHVVHATASHRSGRWQYFVSLVRSIRRFLAPRLEVEAPGWQHSAPMLAVLACNGSFLGGGMRVAPGASFDDGLFDMVVVDDMGFAEALTHIPRLLSGRLGESRRVQVLQTDAVEIRGDAPLQCDGELLGRTPARIRILPASIRVMVDARGGKTPA